VSVKGAFKCALKCLAVLHLPAFLTATLARIRLNEPLTSPLRTGRTGRLEDWKNVGAEFVRMPFENNRHLAYFRFGFCADPRQPNTANRNCLPPPPILFIGAPILFIGVDSFLSSGPGRDCRGYSGSAPLCSHGRPALSLPKGPLPCFPVCSHGSPLPCSAPPDMAGVFSDPVTG